MTRRQALTAAAGATVGLSGVVGTSAIAASRAAPGERAERDELDKLHQAALAEGGELVVFAGSDSPSDQPGGFEEMFATRFPGMRPTVVQDYSKYHDGRIDNQLARDRLEVDVATLQTLHDYPRWKREGHLLRYRPLGWDQVYPQLKDPGGAFTAVFLVTFSNVVNTSLVPEAEAPRDARDYLDPRYKGKLVFVYPNDDDALLYMFGLVVRKYGWDYLDGLLAQEPEFIRGTGRAGGRVASGDKIATWGSWSLTPVPDNPVRLLLPREDEFLTWPQAGAIFAKAKHPAAAKLYLSWLLSREFQDDPVGWSVRRDSPNPPGLGNVFDHTDPLAFGRFMADRTAVERLRLTFDMYLGNTQGESPTGVRGPFVVTPPS